MWYRRLLMIAVACMAFVTTSCWQLTPPTGDAPLRYRDQVFSNVTVNDGIVFGSANNDMLQPQTLLLDMYRPAGDTVTKRPAIVWVHGGGFVFGTRKSAELVDQARYFARQGYVNVSIDYRLSSYGCDLANVSIYCTSAVNSAQHDAQAAVRFLRKNAALYGVDPNRIAMAGSSAGAMTAMSVAYRSSIAGGSGNAGYPSNVQAAVSLSGYYIYGGAFDANSAPTLLMHNNPDPIVPYDLAKSTVDRAKAAGKTSMLTTWNVSGHMNYNANKQQILNETTNFLYRALDLANAAR